MNIVYARSPLPKSIFLAGPTPRDSATPSWRPQALAYLEDKLRFWGTVFVPEAGDGEPHSDYDGQIHWEWEALNQATMVVFWIPRTLDRMPAFTTNVEFGMLAASGKLAMGYPEGAAKMSYLHAMAERFDVPVYSTMEEVLAEAVRRTKLPFGS